MEIFEKQKNVSTTQTIDGFTTQNSVQRLICVETVLDRK